MSYLALARKWRPRTFAEVSGQRHVVDALANALDSGRVHHAFLLTGTRGVGKTTLGRIFAKALNCEKGTSSKPCGKCGACESVDRGNYIDLIEVDAASRTRVDDTRELLDNVQYAPTTGRFKIYLIDEVHMLSGHSFNALLKTLEEPPEHVKFLLATTDPRKLPVTVLSRCLQFHLRALDREQIAARLQLILKEEKVAFDIAAVNILSRSANGSVRDALSLLDQAIAFGGGEVRESQVRTMLGMIDEIHITGLLESLAMRDSERAMREVANMAEKSLDYVVALDDLLLCLHRLSLVRLAPQAAEQLDGAPPGLAELAPRFSEEDLQWYYQAALLGKRDLSLAADARSGFEMVLLRMLVFHLEEGGSVASAHSPARTATPAVATQQKATATPKASRTAPVHASVATSATDDAVATSRAPTVGGGGADSSVDASPASPAPSFSLASLSADTWSEWIAQAPLQVVLRELAMHSVPVQVTEDSILMRVDEQGVHLKTDTLVASLAKCLSAMTGVKVRVRYEKEVAAPGATPAARRQQQTSDADDKSRQRIEQDPNMRLFETELDAALVPDSIESGRE